MKISRAWLQKYFEKPLPGGAEIEDAFTFHSFEIEESFSAGEDAILDVKVLPNRAADCMSHRGIAKDLAAILDVPMKVDPLRAAPPSFPLAGNLAVRVENPELCDRYMGAIIRGVNVGPSPAWLRTAIEAVGQRSINNVVDATNYVMLDLGQPLHAFDAAKLSHADGKYSITVRSATDGEKITSLSGDEYTLTPETLLITDDGTNEPVGIAGVKGGKAAGITEATTNIILESAHFNYASVRKTAQRLKLFTDASSRFQNNPSAELAGYGMQAVISLILDIAGGTLEGVTDVRSEGVLAVPVSVTLEKVNGVLGTTISMEEAGAILKRLDLSYTVNGDTFTVTPPFERRDLVIPEDLVEEIGRIYGYENIEPAALPKLEAQPEMNKRFFYAEAIRETLTNLGFSEIMTYAFQDAGDLEVLSPLASDKAFLRPNLTKDMEKALLLNSRNADLLGLQGVRLFEIGAVFSAESEHVALSIGVSLPGKKAAEQEIAERQKAVDVLEAKTALSFASMHAIGSGMGEIDLDALVSNAPDPDAYAPFSSRSELPTYHSISAYPFVLRDIAVWVPEAISKQDVEALIREKAGALLVRVTLFDEFRKEGKVSYAFRLVFQSHEKTLSDDEVNAVMTTVTEVLNVTHDWQVR